MFSSSYIICWWSSAAWRASSATMASSKNLLMLTSSLIPCTQISKQPITWTFIGVILFWLYGHLIMIRARISFGPVSLVEFLTRHCPLGNSWRHLFGSILESTNSMFHFSLLEFINFSHVELIFQHVKSTNFQISKFADAHGLRSIWKFHQGQHLEIPQILPT